MFHNHPLLRIIHSGPQSQKREPELELTMDQPPLHQVEVQISALEGALGQETRPPSPPEHFFRYRNSDPSSEVLCPAVPGWQWDSSPLTSVSARLQAGIRGQVWKVQLNVWAGWRGPRPEPAAGRSCYHPSPKGGRGTESGQNLGCQNRTTQQAWHTIEEHHCCQMWPDREEAGEINTQSSLSLSLLLTLWSSSFPPPPLAMDTSH